MRAQKIYSAWNEGEEHSGIEKQHIGDAGSGGLMPEDGRVAAHKLNLNGVIIIILACCMGALTIYSMLFMVNFFTRQLQNMVGIVYEQDAAVAQELLRGMFDGKDRAEYGMDAAINLGYTSGAFSLWNRVNDIYSVVCLFALFTGILVCGIVCQAVLGVKRQRMAGIENGHAIGRLRREIKAKEEYYKDREQEIQVFMENVAHQLKTPLAAVMVNLELLDGKERQHDERLKEKCIEDIEHMKELLMLLLNSARIRVGKLHFNKRKLDIASLLDRLELENDGLIMENIESCMITADEEWLYQAIKNIVENGLVYGKVLMRESCESEKLRLDIVDEGPGINKNDVSRMFDRYYIGENSRKDSTGIGLNLAYMVIKAHGGDIVVHDNEKAKGCTISICLPRYNIKEKVKIC